MKKRMLSLVLVSVLLCTVFVQPARAESDRWEVINTGNVTGEDIVAKAREFYGTPYTSSSDYRTRTGFGDPVRFDCSGFVYRVLREVDLGSPRPNYTMGFSDPDGNALEGRNSAGYYYITAHTQEQRYYGTRLTDAVNQYIATGDYSGFKPGDLMCFSYNGGSRISHMGIYIGEGKVIHATTSKGVYETHLTQGGWPNGQLGDSLVDATRLVEDKPVVKGDMNGDSLVNNDDVVALMWYVLFPADNPIVADGDVNHDEAVNNDDIVALMWFVLFPEDNPI